MRPEVAAWERRRFMAPAPNESAVSRASRVATNRVAVAPSYTLRQANTRRFLRIVSAASAQSQRVCQALQA